MLEKEPYINWYSVLIDSDAEFILPTQSEETAYKEITEFCDENKFLNLDPKMMLPHGVLVKQLSMQESNFYNKIQNETNVQPIRLIRDNRKLPLPKFIERINNSTQRCIGQLSLFNTNEII